MIRQLEISWEHGHELTEIPVITSDTKKTFCDLLKELAPAFEREGIVLKFLSKETPGATERSSRVTLNGRSLEDLLTGGWRRATTMRRETVRNGQSL